MERISRLSNDESVPSINPSLPPPWKCFGTRCPRQEIVFFTQALLVYIVVLASIINLSCTDDNTSLWVALLGSSIGIMLPSPSVKNPFKRRGGADALHTRHGPDLDLSATP